MRSLTRYILKEFILYLVYSIIAFIVIFILVNLVEKIDTFIDDSIGYNVIIAYYLFYLPFIIVLTMPMSMLISTMFSLGRLVSDNEITAMKASGISLYRILMPLYVFSLLLGICVMIFSELVVPKTNLLMKKIENREINTENFSFTFLQDYELDKNNVFVVNDDGQIIYAHAYRAKNNLADGVFIIKVLENKTARGEKIPMQITRKIDARYMTYSDSTWYLHDVVVRTFKGDETTYNMYPRLAGPFIVRKPVDFARIDLQPQEMDYFQLKNYINQVKAKGEDATEWLVDLYLKISFPFVSFVIVFFGAPLAVGSIKRGKTASFGIALMIVFIFYTLVHACQVFGRNKALDPLFAAWFPNILFFAIGFFIHVKASK